MNEIVGLTFVDNVIKDPAECDRELRESWSFASGVRLVSIHLEDGRDDVHIKP